MDALTQVGNFLFNNLETVVAVGGGAGALLFIFGRKPRNPSNDLTQRYIKYKKQMDGINNTTKSVF